MIPLLFSATESGSASDQESILPSGCYSFDELPVKKATNGNETRQVFTGETHEGYPIDLHLTTLQPGNMPHPAHTHVHEEMVFMQAGTLEVTIMGKAKRIGPGSVAFVHSQELHGWKNVGDTPATYFVLAMGHQAKA